MLSIRTPLSRCSLDAVLIFVLIGSTSAFLPNGGPHLSSKRFGLHVTETARLASLDPTRTSGFVSPRRRSMSMQHSSTSLHHDIDAQVEDDNLSPPISSQVSTETNIMELNNLTKILNAVLLIASFGWAMYTILQVDEGMTRGWTQQEIMMRVPIDNWRTYEYNLHESPIETKTFINVIIYLLGDWLSQTIFQKKNVLDFDAGRTLKNGFIGLCFGPLVHEYYEFSDRILPLDVDINRLYKILMDQTIYLVVKCSIYIVAVGLLNGSTFQEAVDNVKNRIKNIMFTAWSFWPLVHCVTYTVIPARHRILWVNCVDLVWNAILATKARRDEPVEIVEVIEGPTVENDQSLSLCAKVEFEDDNPPVLMDEALAASGSESQICNGTDATAEELEPAAP